MWFQQDDATAHTDEAAMSLLMQTFGDCLISKRSEGLIEVENNMLISGFTKNILTDFFQI